MVTGTTEVETISQAVFDALAHRDPAALAERVHPQAEWELVTAKGAPVRGRAAIVQAFEQAWSGIHDVQTVRVRPLSGEAAIVEGRSRYALEGGGFADARVVWLHEVRDGALWRVRLFSSVDAAEDAWRAPSAPEPAPTGERASRQRSKWTKRLSRSLTFSPITGWRERSGE